MLNVYLLENDVALRMLCWWGVCDGETKKMSVQVKFEKSGMAEVSSYKKHAFAAMKNERWRKKPCSLSCYTQIPY